MDREIKQESQLLELRLLLVVRCGLYCFKDL